MKDTHTIFVSVVVEPNDEGYLASVPGLQGALAEGDTIEEAIFNCIDVVKMIASYRAERGEGLGFNQVELTSKTRMTVAIPVGMSMAKVLTNFGCVMRTGVLCPSPAIAGKRFVKERCAQLSVKLA